MILLKKITKWIQFASLIAGSRSLELRDILKSKSSFSLFPYFVHIQSPHSIYYISFSYPLPLYHSPFFTYSLFTTRYFNVIHIYIFSLNLFPVHNFSYFFLSSSLSLSLVHYTITQPLTVVIQLPSPSNIIHSFVRSLDSPQLQEKMEHLSREEEHLVTEKPGYSNLTHRCSNANWIEKWERERMCGRREKFRRSPYRHAFRFQVMPSLVHLVQSSLQHNRVILARQRAQQLPSRAVQRRVHVSVRLDFRL